MLKVVVIDGNSISRNLLTSVLLNGGYDVIGESNLTPTGLAQMIKLKPQLVCIDIGTHDDEGFDRINVLRTGLPKAVMFMVSGQIDAPTVQRALEKGVHGFIVKPFNPATVHSHIRNTVLKVAKQHQKSAADNGAA